MAKESFSIKLQQKISQILGKIWTSTYRKYVESQIYWIRKETVHVTLYLKCQIQGPKKGHWELQEKNDNLLERAKTILTSDPLEETLKSRKAWNGIFQALRAIHDDLTSIEEDTLKNPSHKWGRKKHKNSGKNSKEEQMNKQELGKSQSCPTQ
jgi:hypothetical protein